MIIDFPPNYDDILELNPPINAIFSYNGEIYNPTREKIPEDIIVHEKVHFKQQREDSEKWWKKYIADSNFRQDQEVEAFAEQLKWIKERYTQKGVKEALREMAENLSKNYRLRITISQAETLIRKNGK